MLSDMRVSLVWTIVALVTVVAAQYVEDPNEPGVLIPVSPDFTRPRVRLRPQVVEQPPDRFGICKGTISFYS